MSYGTDNELTRTNGIPSTGGKVYGTYTQGQSSPAQQPQVPQPAFNAAQPNGYQTQQVPQGYQQPIQNFQQPQTFQNPAGNFNNPAAIIAPNAYPEQTVQQPYGYPQQPQYPQHATDRRLPEGYPVAPQTQVYQDGIPQGNFNAPYGQPQVPAQVQQQPQVPQTPVATPAPELGNSYIETSINHLTASLGVSADAFDKVYENAIKHGDPSLINPSALGVNLTPEQAQQVQQLAQGAVQYVQAVNAQNQAIVHSVAGSADNWNQAIAKFNTVADPQTAGYVSYLVDNGQTKAAAEYVLNTVRNYGYMPQGQQPLQSSATAGQQGLTSAAFKQAVGELRREVGNGSLEQGMPAQKLQALMQQRALGKAQGLQ